MIKHQPPGDRIVEPPFEVRSTLLQVTMNCRWRLLLQLRFCGIIVDSKVRLIVGKNKGKLEMELLAEKRVLVPIDFSKESFEAFSYAVKFVEDLANIYVLHVSPRPEATGFGIIWQSIVDDHARKQSARNAFFEQFSHPEYQGLHFDTLIGDPVAEILDHAKTHNVDFIVLSCHTRTDPQHYLTRSVAEEIVRLAEVPILALN